MLKKLLILSLIPLFCLTLLPMQAKACSSNGVKAGSLLKASNASVYYYGANDKRYVFPNEKTYKSWFNSFDSVIAVSDNLLGEIPIGGNVTYKPGKKLVKITTDPKVYWVDKEGTLRWVKTASIAKQLFGSSWQSIIDDIPDPFFINYKIGLPIETTNLPTIEAAYSINQDKTLSNEPDPSSNELGAIDLSGVVNGNRADLKWAVSNFTSEQGFKIVMGNQPDPVYPGNDYHYLSDPNTRTDSWYDLTPGTYYFRACEYLGGSCGIYSNNLMLKVIGDGSEQTKTISATAVGDLSDVKITWTTNFTSSQGFKIVKAEHSNPVYPGDDYHYLSDPASTSDLWTGLPAGTWHFRVCEYLGDKCGVYSNDMAVTIYQDQVIPDIWVSASVTGNSVKIDWDMDFASFEGFKIIKATHENPVYPGDDYQYITDTAARSYTWENLPAGTYHFRVCEYRNGGCNVYSNDVTATVSGIVQDNSNGSITLSGSYDQSLNKVLLNWTVSDMYSDLGFKVVYSTNPNPVYPGNDYHYLSDPDVRNDNWAGLEPGTYHFRVCEYLGGSCGIYSNDITVNIE